MLDLHINTIQSSPRERVEHSMRNESIVFLVRGVLKTVFTPLAYSTNRMSFKSSLDGEDLEGVIKFRHSLDVESINANNTTRFRIAFTINLYHPTLALGNEKVSAPTLPVQKEDEKNLAAQKGGDIND